MTPRVLAVLALFTTACSGDATPPPVGQHCANDGNPTDGGAIVGLLAGSSNGTCADLLSGTKSPGETCSDSKECKPVCCACPASIRSAQAAWCLAGSCATPNDVCCAFAEEYAADAGLICQ